MLPTGLHEGSANVEMSTFWGNHVVGVLILHTWKIHVKACKRYIIPNFFASFFAHATPLQLLVQ